MTTDHQADSEVFRSVLIEDARKRAGDHPELDKLVDYLTGELDQEADEKTRDHLAACRECATVVLDLEPLVKPDEAPEGVADLELETAWRDLQSRMADSPRLEGSERGFRSPGPKRWPLALAASLLVAAVGLSVWVSQLRQTTSDLTRQVATLSEPQVNMPVFYVDELTRSSGRDLEVEVPFGASYFALIFASANLGTHESYEVQFIDSDGTEVLRSSGLQVSDSGGLRLGLPRGLLPAGEYLIRLWPHDGAERQPIEEYRRQVSYLEAP